MKTTSQKSVKNSLKKKSARTPKAQIPKLPKARKKTVAPRLAARKAPVSIRTGAPKGGDSDRGLYVRFDSPAIKALVKAAADAQMPPASMNAFIVAAALDWVTEKRMIPADKDAIAAAG
jgi:hypothetical protein